MPFEKIFINMVKKSIYLDISAEPDVFLSFILSIPTEMSGLSKLAYCFVFYCMAWWCKGGGCKGGGCKGGGVN